MFKKPVNQLVDHEERLYGKCATCQHLVECFRWQARTVTKGETLKGGGNPFGDVPHVPCPKCGASVYMLPKKKGDKNASAGAAGNS